MATPVDYIDFICGQIDGKFSVLPKKMFGEYMIYINSKPLLLVCDSTVYVKKVDETSSLLNEVAVPYAGAKERYILDVDNRDLVNKVILILDRITPLPKPKKSK